MTNKTKATTFDELLARHKAMEAEIFGTPEEQKTLSPLAENAYKTAFGDFLHGEHPTNALSAGRDGSGGYLIPDELERQLIEGLAETNVLRNIGTVMKIDHDRKIPVVKTKGVAYFVDEEGVILESDDAFEQVKLGSYKAVTETKVSEELLEDSAFDLESYIIREFARRIGDLEEDSFVTGTGVGMPLGLINSAPIGAVTDSDSVVTPDDLLDLLYSVPDKYRAKSHWLFSEDLEYKLRKLRLMNGRPMFEDAMDTGDVDRFLGYPVLTCRTLPKIEPGAKVALFGDFSYLWIADRGRPSFKRLDELYAKSGQIGFRATKRVDAKLVLPEAVKVLQVKE